MNGLSLLEVATDPASAGRVALVVGGEELRFVDLAPRVSAFCRGLLARGISAGSRAAIIAPNGVETVIAIYALLELGATLVPIHPRLTSAEVDAILEDGSAEVLLREADLAELTSASASVPASAPVSASVPVSVPAPVSAHDPICAIVHTSGTSGRPKGAMLPRSAFLASAAASAANLGWNDDDRWLLCMPLCHIGGLSILTRSLLARAAVILPAASTSRFDPRAILESIRRDRATLISVVPTMLHALLEADRDGDLRKLRAALIGGAATPVSLLQECAARGVQALTTYGLTEACSQVTSQRPRAIIAVEPGSGRPLPGVALQITRETGEPAAIDEVGRIQLRGPTLMRGYWPGPSASAAGAPASPSTPPSTAAWFDTGDLGSLDHEGRLHVRARRTDLIVTGGENVYPVEIEQAIEASPGVLRALVFGASDDRWGQIVCAAIVLDPSRPSDEPALLASLAARLAPHKRPRRLCFVDALPLTPSRMLDRAAAARTFTALLRPVR